MAQFSVMLLSVTLLVAVALIDDRTDCDKKFFSKLSLIFFTISTTLISFGYFIQLTTVKWHFEQNQLEGLAQFVQFYPHSAILSVIMLGYIQGKSG